MAAEAPTGVRQFLKSHCYDCHEGESAEAGLDLSALSSSLDDGAAEQQWVRIFDRVHDGEMPPADHGEPDPKARDAFLKSTGEWIRSDQTQRYAELGRVRARRLTRRELERSLQDLLGIDIPLADKLPEEAKTAGFTTVANGQAMSHFQLERHLAVVDIALDEAFRRALTPEDRYSRDFDAEGVARDNPRRRTREPEMRNGQAVVWSSGLIYYGRIPATTAPEDGWYRFKVRISALKPPESGGVWTTVKTGLCVSSAPLLTHVTAFEATPEPRDIEFEAWLPRRHMLEIRPGDTTLKKGRFEGGQVGTGEGEDQDLPGIAIDRLTMERIHHGACDDEVRDLLFGDLSVEREDKRKDFRVVSKSPEEDLARLISTFARRAFRRPVSSEQLAGYVELAQTALEDGEDFTDALRIGYRALLCSPRFLYLTEDPGRLDDHAIAARLSYFLTGSTPDARLTELADAGRLHDPKTIIKETDRLLAGDGGRQFLQDFAAEWLDLDQIDFTTPDTRMFRDFDSIVQHSMLDETHSFLETMLRGNLGVARLMDADFTFLNSRLARFYEIDGVEGDDLQKVSLSDDTHRGGILTHGALLKVTANGSTTSPVIRGVWVSERLLGEEIPPVPAGIPAIEPDIRGATSIREQLEKHRSQASCASCHVKIDPPGYALENFDPAGQWRDRYAQLVRGRRERGPEIDPSYVLPDGREFEDVDDFRDLIADNPRKLAKNVAEKMLVYGTGAPASFADRDAIEQIADKAKTDEYGFRSVLYAVVTSPVFLSK
jgi:hypothetical protein